MVRMIFLATGRYPKAHDWVYKAGGGNAVYPMIHFEAADRTIRELCPGIHFSSAPPVERGTRIHSYFDKEGLVGLVVERERR